jgi:hypothetical protein
MRVMGSQNSSGTLSSLNSSPWLMLVSLKLGLWQALGADQKRKERVPIISDMQSRSRYLYNVKIKI